MAKKRTKWAVVSDTKYIEHYSGRGPAWTYDRKEAEALTSMPDGPWRVVDAEKFVAETNARLAKERAAAEKEKPVR